MSVARCQMYEEIAPRLFGLRESLGLSRAGLARKIEADPELVADYENAGREIPVSYLMDVACACGVNLADLLSGDEAHLRNYTAGSDGEWFSIARRADYDYKNLAFRFADSRMDPALAKVPPKAREEVICVSHEGRKFFHVLEGKLELRLGEEVLVLEPGDSVYFSAAISHGLRGLEGKQAVFVSVII